MRRLLFVLPLAFGLSACAPFKPSAQTSNAKQYHLGEKQVLLTGTDGALEPKKPEIETKSTEDVYKELSEKLNRSFAVCSDRAWPGYSMLLPKVLMVQKGSDALVWDPATKTVTRVGESEVPASVYQGTFDMLEYQGGSAISIMREHDDFDASVMYDFVVHEGFHFTAQRSWTGRGAARGTLYPSLSLPRLYRAELAKALKTYLESNGSDTSALKIAAHWFGKWKTEFPKESENTTDGYEGTARFFEHMMQALEAKGCDASPEQLFVEMKKSVFSDLDHMVAPKSLALDSEGYVLGNLAAIALEFVEKKKDWRVEMSTGKTPVEVLLENVEKLERPASETLKIEIEKAVTTDNTIVGKDLEPELARYKSNAIRIVFPDDSLGGSFSPKGFYTIEELNGMSVFPLALEKFALKDSWSAALKPNLVIFRNVGTSCQGGWVTVANESEILITEKMAKVTRPSMNVMIPGSLVTDTAGQKWFCVGDQAKP